MPVSLAAVVWLNSVNSFELRRLAKWVISLAALPTSSCELVERLATLAALTGFTTFSVLTVLTVAATVGLSVDFAALVFGVWAFFFDLITTSVGARSLCAATLGSVELVGAADAGATGLDFFLVFFAGAVAAVGVTAFGLTTTFFTARVGAARAGVRTTLGWSSPVSSVAT